MENKICTNQNAKFSFSSLNKTIVCVLLLFICSVSHGQLKLKNPLDINNEELPFYDKTAHIVALTAIYEDSKSNLTWTVKNQRKNGTYLIERSEDGIHYTIEGIEKGVPTKRRKERVFSFSNNENPEDLVYYRIKHIANDNSILISEKVALFKAEREDKNN